MASATEKARIPAHVLVEGALRQILRKEEITAFDLIDVRSFLDIAAETGVVLNPTLVAQTEYFLAEHQEHALAELDQMNINELVARFQRSTLAVSAPLGEPAIRAPLFNLAPSF
ncbi:hypothetical protein ISS86_02795 [Candidatus Microgenomates bacterium]|nr:hypothetical protein [Candidatus Microgenomates bacterium]